MKIAVFFLVFCMSSLMAASSYAQNIKLNVQARGATLESVFKQIKKQSNYMFFYNTSDVNKDVIITVKKNNATITEIMDVISAELGLSYTVKNHHVVLKKTETDKLLIQQSIKKITGTIVDINGETIIGASIVVKGTTNGTTTDFDGKFVLDVPDNTILLISYISYVDQEIIVKGKSIFAITMKENSEVLDEVVVVGYGVQKKANLSGSVSSINSKDLKNRPITNVSSGIQGLMPGVTVTSGQGRPGQDNGSIRVRGVGTLNSSDPYILIDGIESGSMNSLDPNDIESITVLKDASSAAIYGSKASNGVILITTKRGAEGKARISYNAYIGIQNPTCLVERMNSLDYASMTNQVLANEGKAPLFTDDEIQKFRDGSDPYNYSNTDWSDLAYQTGIQHQHNVNISGGAENVKYMASAGYMNQKGILRNSSREQFNARTNLDVKFSDKLDFRVNLAYINNNYSDPNSCYAPGSSDQIIRQINQISPWITNKNEDGTYGTGSAGNPIAWLDLGQTIDHLNQNFTGTIAVDYKITNDIKASLQTSYISNSQDYKAFKKDIQYNPNNYDGPNELTEKFYRWNRMNIDFLLNYDKSFGKHNLKALVGYHAEKYNYKENSMYRQGFPNNDITDINAGTTSSQTNEGFTRALAMLSYFGRVNYDYAGKYLFEANIRSDASSRFSPDNRWGYFPSLSGAWRISEEEFMGETKDWLDNLKIRASWGLLGNQDALTDYYPWMNTYSIGANYPFGGTLNTGYYQEKYNLSTISWEQARTWGIGLDMTFLQNFNLVIDYYDRLTTDIIMDVPVPTEFALGAYKDNVGEMINRGVEVSLGYQNRWNDWSFGVSGNFSYNKNEIQDLGGVDRMIKDDKIKSLGSAVNSYYVYEADGFFQSDESAQTYMDQYKGKSGYPFSKDFKAGDLIYKDVNGDGLMTSEDRIIAGSTDPKFIFGLNLNAGYKGVDVSAIFTGAAGVSRLFNKEVYGSFEGDAGHPSTAWLDAWTPENTDATMPRASEELQSPSNPQNTVSTFWVQNSSYLRMKSLQVGYTFPSSCLKKIGLSNVRFYYSAENLFTIDKLLIGVDPESPEGRGSHFPLTKTHSFGVNLTF